MEEQNTNTTQIESKLQEEKITFDDDHSGLQKITGKGGPFVGVVVIIILLIFVGLYFWGAEINIKTQSEEKTALNNTTNNDIATPNDEPAKIESDLNTFDTASFDAGLNSDLKAVESKI